MSESIEPQEKENPYLLPNLRTGSEIFIASDYAGEKLNYRAISFILLNLPGNEEWDKRRSAWREKFLRDGREISYKSLRASNQTAEALIPFLEAADCINGLLITFLFERAIGNIIAKNQRAAINQHLNEFARWNDYAFEKLFCVTSLLGVLVAGLSREGQNIWWATDQDEIVANEQRLLTATKTFGAISGGYLPHKLGELRCVTDVFDQGTGLVKDLVSLPDLASGALAEMWHWNATDGALPTGKEFVPISTKIPAKSRFIVEWFARQGKPLKRLVCVFEPSDGPQTQLKYSWPGFEATPVPG